MLSENQKLLFAKQAEIAKAIAHPLRVAIIDFLKGGERCVCEIAEYVGSQRSNVSRHLSVMVRAGILEYRKEGLKVLYRLRTPCILDFFSCTTACLKAQYQDNHKALKAL